MEALAEAWEFQRKYGTMHRDADTQNPSVERPPPFTPYIPGTTRALPRGALSDIYQATVAEQSAAAASSAQATGAGLIGPA